MLTDEDVWGVEVVKEGPGSPSDTRPEESEASERMLCCWKEAEVFLFAADSKGVNVGPTFAGPCSDAELVASLCRGLGGPEVAKVFKELDAVGAI